MTVVFPQDEDMTIINQGAFGMVKELTHAGDGIRRGVKRWMTTPSYAPSALNKRILSGRRGISRWRTATPRN